MHCKFHDYQVQAYEHLLAHPKCALFLPMGLGKTVTCLTAISRFLETGEVRKVLVIAPKRVAMSVWAEEARKWDHLSHLTFSKVLGTAAQRQRALEIPADIYVTNRENIPWLADTLGKSWDFDAIVIDELSSFRTHTSKRFKALAKKTGSARRVIGLTGTPTPKGLENLWAQVFLLDQGARFGKYGEFLKTYFIPHGPAGSHVVYSWEPRPGAPDQILASIRDICLSIEPPPGLQPEQRRIIRRVHLPDDVMAKYRTLEQQMVLRLGSETVSASEKAALMGKLQQIASGAVYGQTPGTYIPVHDEKLDELELLLEEAAGRPILCFYWYKHEAARIRQRFPFAVTIEGNDTICAWNEGQVPLLLAHPASSGHGLNLQQGGSIIVWFGLTVDLELYEQANARLARQGQKEIVRIYHLIADGTRDEDLLPILSGKALTQDTLIASLIRRNPRSARPAFAAV